MFKDIWSIWFQVEDIKEKKITELGVFVFGGNFV